VTASDLKDEPPKEEPADGPPADKASGVAIAPPHEEHRFADALLALPRETLTLLFEGPRYAAGELDDYLEKRSPNLYARDVHSAWRFGAIVDWETALGPSMGARIGRELGDAAALDGYVGFFGARGQSAGAWATFGQYTEARLQPVLSIDAGRELERVYSGIGMRGPRGEYKQQAITASPMLVAHAGPFAFGTRAAFDASRTDDPDDALVANYDLSQLRGFDETERAVTGELFTVFDTRAPAYSWIPKAAPSSGWYARAGVSYTRGSASRTGEFATWRGALEARRLFDLFRGDRVLSFGARADAVSADADELPFDRLPSLGGNDQMRAFARDELRARSALYGDVQYEWALGRISRAYIFVETGAVATDAHVGYGGGFRLLSGAATSARFQIAGSNTGDIGFYLQLGRL